MATRATWVATVTAGFAVTVVAASAGAAVFAFRHGGSGTATQAAPSPKRVVATAPLVTSRTYLGVFTDGLSGDYRQVLDFGKNVGRKADIVLYYNAWGGPFALGPANLAHAHGAIPFVQLMPKGISMTAISAGVYDAYLRTYAAAVRKYGHQVILSFAPEAMGPWYSWGWTHTSPAKWKAAWRHVVTLFRRSGTRNVTWLMTINHLGRHASRISRYWPGESYVDWVGIDGYYERPSDTFSSLFKATIRTVRHLTSDPILLSESAVGPLAGQTVKIPNLFAGIRRNHLLGVVWFDKAQYRGLHHQDWRLEDNPAALEVFRREVMGLG